MQEKNVIFVGYEKKRNIPICSFHFSLNIL